MKCDLSGHRSKWRLLPVIAFALFLSACSNRSKIAGPQPVVLLAPDTYQVTHIALSPDGAQLAEVIAAASDPVIRFFDARTGEHQYDSVPVRDLPGAQLSGSRDKGRVSYVRQENPLVWIDYAPDGKTLNSIDAAGALLEWDGATGKLQRQLPSRLPSHGGKVIAVSPDGKKVITLRGAISRNNPPLVWDRTSGTMQGRLKVDLWAWHGLTFSPDGQVIASAEKDHTIKLWDARSGKLLRTLVTHRGTIASLAFSPDGSILVSSSHNFTKPQRGCELRFWRVADGFELYRPIDAPDWVEHLSFLPDGRLAGTGFKSVFLWDIQTGKMTQEVRGNWPIRFAKNSNIMAAKDTDGFGMGHDVLLWNYK